MVGGGLEGSLLASALHDAGHKVALLEQGKPRDPAPPYDMWVNSPLLLGAERWRQTRNSIPFWDNWAAAAARDGIVMALRESPSWGKVEEGLREMGITPQPAHLQGMFPELITPAEVGTAYLPDLPVVEPAGVAARVWRKLQRDGANPNADTRVSLIDWEHEWPTAVTRDRIFRGKRLYLTGGVEELFNQPLPVTRQKRTWLEAEPVLDRPFAGVRPVLWVHYALAPFQVLPFPDRFGFGREREPVTELEEIDFLRSAQKRWLSCEFKTPAVYALEVPGWLDGVPVVDHHPWRDDCIWMAGLGQPHWGWYPALLPTLVDPQGRGGLPPELSWSRTLQPAADAPVYGPQPA